MSIEYIPSASEIAYNILVMEDAMQSDPEAAGQIDVGFIGILQGDIDLLEKSQERDEDVREITSSLERVALRLFEAQPTKAPHLQPELAPVVTISDEEQITDIPSYYDSTIRDGLEKIGVLYGRYRVAPDGHCLFRSMLFIFLSSYPERIAVVLEEILEVEQFAPLKQAFEDLYGGRKTALEICQDPELSDRFVAALRKLAAYEIARRGEQDPEYRRTIEAIGTKNFQTYLDDMREMATRTYGDDPEFQALTEAIGIPCPMLDAHFCGEGSMEPKLPDDALFGLLKRGEHYDVLSRLPTQEEVDRDGS